MSSSKPSPAKLVHHSKTRTAYSVDLSSLPAFSNQSTDKLQNDYSKRWEAKLKKGDLLPAKHVINPIASRGKLLEKSLYKLNSERRQIAEKILAMPEIEMPTQLLKRSKRRRQQQRVAEIRNGGIPVVLIDSKFPRFLNFKKFYRNYISLQCQYSDLPIKVDTGNQFYFQFYVDINDKMPTTIDKWFHIKQKSLLLKREDFNIKKTIQKLEAINILIVSRVSSSILINLTYNCIVYRC